MNVMVSKFEAIKGMITVLRPTQKEWVTDAHAMDMVRIFNEDDEHYYMAQVVEGRGYPHILRDMVCTIMSK